MEDITRPQKKKIRALRVALVVAAGVILSTAFFVGNARALSVLGALATGSANVVYGGASSASLTASSVCPLDGGVCSGTLTSRVGNRMPFAMTLSNLYAFQASAPGSGSSCTFLVRTSAGSTATYQSTPLSCTIGAGATTCANTSASLNVAAGDSVQIEFIESGTCQGYVNWGLAGTYSQ
jgi:hypothetical protein